MSTTDDVLGNAEQYASSFDKGDLPMPPGRKLAVVACMDARLDPDQVLGLEEGDAHVIRNAGGVVTDDAIRSLAISQRLLGTEEIVLIHHTDCGMLTFTDDEFQRSIQDETGVKPSWAAEAFSDLDEDVRQSIARIKASPFIPRKTRARLRLRRRDGRPARGQLTPRPVPGRRVSPRRAGRWPSRSTAMLPRVAFEYGQTAWAAATRSAAWSSVMLGSVTSSATAIVKPCPRPGRG